MYTLLISFATPRPIALVSSLSPEGVRNLAPYSFFNVFGYAPPYVRANLSDGLDACMGLAWYGACRMHGPGTPDVHAAACSAAGSFLHLSISALCQTLLLCSGGQFAVECSRLMSGCTTGSNGSSYAWTFVSHWHPDQPSGCGMADA